MKSRVPEVIGQLEAWKQKGLQTSGAVLAEAYRKEIVDAGLVDTGAWLKSVTYHVDGDTVYSGTPIGDPPYPWFLEAGFRHYQSGELVGPYWPLLKSVSASEDELRRVWSTI
jgi:hypothetical protein